MKKRILTIVVALLVMVPSAFAYDFSIQVPSGQTLYFNIIGPNTVEVTGHGDWMEGNLEIPSSVEYESTTFFVAQIGDEVFSFCGSLTSVTIPNSVTSIGRKAFWGCGGLTSINIPNSVTSLGYAAFSGCGNLISVVISSTVTSIETYTFSDCTSLTSITIPNSVTSIGDLVFLNCSSLTSVTISGSVTSIGGDAFYGCTGLTSVFFTGTITQWCGISFAGRMSNPTWFSHNLSVGGAPITALVIPEGVTNIGQYAFYNCSTITSVTIPNSVTSIGSYAFHNCSGLTSVTIPNSVTIIGDHAFYGSGLTSIECMALEPPTIERYTAFYGFTNIPVWVPCGKMAEYQTAQYWNDFANIQEVCGTAGATGVSVNAEGNDIVVEGAAGYAVTLYDNGGNELEAIVATIGESLRFEDLSSGTYYVKIGVLPARMKVEVR